MDTLSRLDWQDKRILSLLITTPLAALTVYHLIRTLLSPPQPTRHIHRSPLPSAQNLPSSSLTTHPYPPTALPGPRTTQTPTGALRAYEFGPKSGRKVLLIHGISTPCIALASLAQELAENHNCRVCLFDLPGRGYSDCADPESAPQDLEFFIAQIFYVLGSSPCPTSWLADGEEGRFTIVGYSLGGGIAAGFASWFPRLVGSLVLIAPSGLLRAERIGRSSRLLYSGLLPQGLVGWLVGRRLRGGGSATPGTKGGNPEATTGPGKAAVGEVPKEGEVGKPEHPALAKDSEASLFSDRPGISVANAVAWELEAHPGFVPAFVSSIQHAPITEQYDRWRVVGKRQELGRVTSADDDAKACALRERKTLVLLGETDSVIVKDETTEDARAAFGEENVQFDVLEGGHDVPIVNAKGCADAIAAFWQ